MTLQQTIENAWDNRELLKETQTQHAIREIIELLDKGQIRVAEQNGTDWTVNQWIKKAVLMYFPIQEMHTIHADPFEYHDKIALKSNYAQAGVRVVPPAVARYGSYIAKGVILMP